MYNTFLETLLRPAAILNAQGVIQTSNEAFGRLAWGRPVPVRGVAWECVFGEDGPTPHLRGRASRVSAGASARLPNGTRVRLSLDVVRLGYGSRGRWLVQVVDPHGVSKERGAGPRPEAGALTAAP